MDWTKIITDIGAPAAFALIALFLLRDESRRHASSLRDVIKSCEQSIQENTRTMATVVELVRAVLTRITPNDPITPKGE
ncbi:MAG: hypothetical protein GXO56_07580 [Chloroflexi bacterium]|nr:hypothetical protein [Chloroflexota bacterium]